MAAEKIIDEIQKKQLTCLDTGIWWKRIRAQQNFKMNNSGTAKTTTIEKSSRGDINESMKSWNMAEKKKAIITQ